jgi:hypothetical protein
MVKLSQLMCLSTRGLPAEHGGLIIGGHRAGTGRNFEGKIDELAIWQGVLNAVEVRKLYQKGF